MPTSPDPVAVLSRCELFAGSPVADVEAVAAVASAMTWRAGAMIFQVGDLSGYMFVVTAGRIRLSLAAASGRELTIRHAGPGSVVGEMGVLDNQPRSATATADVASEGLVVRRAEFERVIADHPELARAVIRYLSRRLRETTARLESATLYDLNARLARFLLAALEQAHGVDLPATAGLTLDLDQSQIAAVLGASRPKLNRALAELAERGSIRRAGKNLACDVPKLQDIAGAEPL